MSGHLHNLLERKTHVNIDHYVTTCNELLSQSPFLFLVKLYYVLIVAYITYIYVCVFKCARCI